MRRNLALGIGGAAILSATLAVTGVASPASACGCGILLGAPDTTLVTSNETAIISWDGETEVIELTFDVDADTGTAGLLIPTPTTARVSDGDLRMFAIAEALVLPRVVVEQDWWGFDFFTPDPEKIEPDTLEQVVLDEFSPQTIPASDGTAMAAWLAAHGYTLTDELERTIRTYASYGWSFTALTLNAEDTIDGHIPPIRLTFDTPNLVYPIRLARAAETPQHLRMYVFDQHRMDVVQAAAPTLSIGGSVRTLYAGPVADARLSAYGPYLTAFDITYDDPGSQVTSDIGFYESLTDDVYLPTSSEYRMVSLLGVPVGTLVVGWVLVGGILVFAHFRGRRRAR